MLNEYLQVAHQHQVKEAASRDLHERMMKLSVEELYKLASGNTAVKKEVTASALVKMAEAMGRSLAQADQEKKSSAKDVFQCMDEAGRKLAAMNPLLASAGKFIKRNPVALVGAGLGAASGVGAGLAPDEHGNRSILKGVAGGLTGAATGGALGHAAQGVGGRMLNGKDLAGAWKGYKTQVGREFNVAKGRVNNALTSQSG